MRARNKRARKGRSNEKRYRISTICDWSGSGVDSEAVGGVWWPSWTDRRTDGWQTMKGSRMQSDEVDTCAWV